MDHPPPTSNAAVVSLVFGILSWVALPVIGAVVAVIAGHVARSDIRRSNLGGDGLALTGLILGYLHLGIVLVGLLLFLGVFGVGLLAALTG
ncbi:MAG: hypothetical protein KatS3mg126_2091 [Lysobacteraceae bacterium]|nr:MAG: hypothetical protein KatS3mg126_2091 [Xanthomonadaceae bacterium]